MAHGIIIPYPSLDLQPAEPNFKDQVIAIVKQIPYGKVTNYGTVAALAGFPRGARLIGGILSYNKDTYNLPWWRVINKQGYLSIRNIEAPKEVQKGLLEAEGVEVSSDFMVDLGKYGWKGYK